MRPEEKLLQICITKRLTLAFAESCTGGALAARFTKMPGVSACFAGSLVSYQERIKTSVLGVSNELLQKFGAVSPETADSMLENCLRLFAADIGASVTGNAGPQRDERNSPVGTIFITMGSSLLGIKKLALRLEGKREEIIEQAVDIIFENLVSLLSKRDIENE